MASKIGIRLMQAQDFDAVVGIDEKVLHTNRADYYRHKFDKLFDSKEFLPTSLVAVEGDGTVVGFVMGELYRGEYGILNEGATLDTIGVDPDCRQRGVGAKLLKEFFQHLKQIGVKKLNTLVAPEDGELLRFFKANKFAPSATVNLEREL